MLTSILHLGLGVFLLAAGAHLLVKGATKLALLLKLSPAVIGLTVVAIGTSLPELFVGLSASKFNLPDLLVGNIVGSNILNMGLVIGLSASILPIKIHTQSVRIEWPVMFAVTLFTGVLLLDGSLHRREGVLLVGLTVFSTLFFLFLGRQTTEPVEGEEQVKKINRQIQHQNKILAFLVCFTQLAVGFICLQVGSDYFVKGASHISRVFLISERVIGLTVVAIGTSLPELAISLTATYKGHSDVAIGNIMGSNIFNVAGILGVCSLVRPTAGFESQLLYYDFPWLLLICVLLFMVIVKSNRITRKRGLLLLGSYVIYTGTLIFS